MSADRQKAMSYSAAMRCEEAREPVCKCRCGGKLHGAKRGDVTALPYDDPHSPTTDCKYCAGKGKVNTLIGLQDCIKCHGQGKVLVETAKKKAGQIMPGSPEWDALLNK